MDENGIYAVLMLDVNTNSKESEIIDINSLLANWKEDTSIHLGIDIVTRLKLNLPFN